MTFHLEWGNIFLERLQKSRCSKVVKIIVAWGEKGEKDKRADHKLIW